MLLFWRSVFMIKIAKKGLKTDLKKTLKSFPNFRTVSPVLLRGTMNLKFKITASYFDSQEILTAPHMPLGTPFFSFTEFLSMFECKDSRKFSALVISFTPFKNFAVAWVDVVRGFFVNFRFLLIQR